MCAAGFTCTRTFPPTARTKYRKENEMAPTLPEVDAVMLGVGLVGTILGRELTRAGLKVVGLERGGPQFTVPDYQGPQIHAELRYAVRNALMQDNVKETVTFRYN